jgi:hypothetical protein
MRTPRTRQHHPLASAGAAAEHFILRHFGFRLTRPEAKETPSRAAARNADRRP